MRTVMNSVITGMNGVHSGRFENFQIDSKEKRRQGAEGGIYCTFNQVKPGCGLISPKFPVNN